jgi:NifB/MoaA-like Fe-S oxidoreductase
VGNAVEHAFQPIVQRLNQIGNLTFEMCSIASQFWGQTLTVTGLLTGQDILSTLSSRSLGDALLLPAVTLKDGERFLDDLSWLDLERILAKPVIRVSGGASGLLQAIKQAADSDPLAPLGKVS